MIIKYKVWPRSFWMILLRDLKRAMRFNRSKDISVHVSTWARYGYKHINASCVEVVTLINFSVSVSCSKIGWLDFKAKKKPCVKLGNNASVTLVQFSPRLMGEKLLKSQVSLNSVNGSNGVAKTWKIMNTRVYPKVSGMAAWSENCKWHSSLPVGAVVSLFC